MASTRRRWAWDTRQSHNNIVNVPPRSSWPSYEGHASATLMWHMRKAAGEVRKATGAVLVSKNKNKDVSNRVGDVSMSDTCDMDTPTKLTCL